MRLSNKLALLLVMALLAACAGYRPADMDAPWPLSSEVIERRLDNGLTYLIRRNANPEQRARLMLVVRTGFVLEDDSQRGAAHFVEHMAFNGTERFPGKGIDLFMQSIGMGTCQCYNGRTTMDETLYTFWIPTDRDEALERAVMVLADIAGHITFDQAEIDKVRGVVIEEWRLGKSHNRENQARAAGLLLEGSRYAARYPSNDKPYVDELDTRQMLRFYRDWYRPELMAVVAVGDFDPSKVEGYVSRHFSELKNPEGAPVRETYSVPIRKGAASLVLSSPETTVYSTGLLQFFASSKSDTMRDMRKRIVRDFYVGLINNRLSERLTQASPPYLKAGVSFTVAEGGDELFSFEVSAEEGRLKGAMAAAMDELGRAMLGGFTDAEVRRSREAIKKQLEILNSSKEPPTSNARADELVRHYLKGEAVPDAQAEKDVFGELVEGVALEDVNLMARAFFQDDSLIILSQVPQGKEADALTQEDALRLLAAMRQGTYASYVDNVTQGELVAAPVSGKVTEVKKYERLGAEQWLLSNGARVIVRPSEDETSGVLLEAYSYGGTSLAPDEDYVAALTAAQVVLAGGLGDFDLTSLAKKLSDKGISINPTISEFSEGISGSAYSEDIESMLQLVHLAFTAPRADSTMFDNIRNNLIVSVEQYEKQPVKQFVDVFNEVMFNNHLRRMRLDAAKIAQMDLNKSLAFYKERFSDASNFTFIVTGRFDPVAIRPMVESYIGGLPSTYRKETWRDVGVPSPKGQLRREVRTGTQEKASVVMMLSGPKAAGDMDGIYLGLLEEILNNRLRDVLREQLSGTYNVKVNVSTGRIPQPEYKISINFNCEPSRVEQLTQAVLDNLQTVREGRELDKYLSPVLANRYKRLENQKKDRTYWMGILSKVYINGDDPQAYSFYEELLGQVTPEGLNEAASRYLALDNYINIVYYSGT